MNLILAKVCSFLTSVPLDTTSSELSGGKAEVSDNFKWVQNVIDVINEIKWPLILLVAAAGSIYAIVLGVQMARADSTEKREEAKKRVINVLLGVAIAVGLTLLLSLFLNYVPDWLGMEKTN